MIQNKTRARYRKLKIRVFEEYFWTDENIVKCYWSSQFDTIYKG